MLLAVVTAVEQEAHWRFETGCAAVGRLKRLTVRCSCSDATIIVMQLVVGLAQHLQCG